MIKKGINESYDLSLEENMKNEIDLLQVVFETQDSVEGMRAFLEKRDPNFTGN